MKKHLFFLACIFTLACNDNKHEVSTDLNKNTVTIHLPSASSNYDDATNFILYDSIGKECIPQSDTVTKGGGTIVYEDLPKGIYSYYIKTIFDEEIKRPLKIDSSASIDFYDYCYDVRDAIESDTLRSARKIDLIIETMNDADINQAYAFKVEKTGSKYFIKNNLANGKSRSLPSPIDSAELIDALTAFQITIIGLRETEIKERNYGYPGANAVYLKCDNHFLQVCNLKDSYLNQAIKKLTRSLIKN